MSEPLPLTNLMIEDLSKLNRMRMRFFVGLESSVKYKLRSRVWNIMHAPHIRNAVRDYTWKTLRELK